MIKWYYVGFDLVKKQGEIEYGLNEWDDDDLETLVMGIVKSDPDTRYEGLMQLTYKDKVYTYEIMHLDFSKSYVIEKKWEVNANV